MPRENLFGADNQQGSPTNIAWLAGHLDGDGWIGIIRAKRTGKDYYRYTASLALMSTSWRNIEKCRAILQSFGVNTYLKETDAYVGKDGSARKRIWNLSLRGNEDTKIALRILVPYLAEKAECARLVLEYIDWRQSQPTRPGGHAENIVRGMREQAEETMRLLREDRNRCDPSETSTPGPASKRVKIQSELHGDMQNAAEMTASPS